MDRAEATLNKAVSGVACESCHGPAGGENGWLNVHSSYGAEGLTREEETPEHKKMRHEAAEKAGRFARPSFTRWRRPVSAATPFQTNNW